MGRLYIRHKAQKRLHVSHINSSGARLRANDDVLPVVGGVTLIDEHVYLPAPSTELAPNLRVWRDAVDSWSAIRLATRRS